MLSLHTRRVTVIIQSRHPKRDAPAAQGIVGTKLAAPLPYLSGDINVGPGDMAGYIKGAIVQASATISVATMSGQITISDDLAGDITASGTVSGSILLDKALGSTAQIQIDGLLTNEIRIDEQTDKYSLIWLRGGLGPNGVVTVNHSMKNFHAKGTIHVGCLGACPFLPGPITFDGAIMIKAGGGGGGGDLGGDIRVVGCHNPGCLTICICGELIGNVVIDQNECENQVGWSCNVPGCTHPCSSG